MMKIGHLELRRDGNACLMVNTRLRIVVTRYDCGTPETSLAEAVAAARKHLTGSSRMKKYYLHLGLEEAFLAAEELFGHYLIINGDGWQAWGEKPNVNGNAGPLHHAIIESDSREELESLQGLLVGMNYPIITLISDAAVWTTLDGEDIP